MDAFAGLVEAVREREDARRKGKNAPLTDTQCAILQWMKDFVRTNGWAPTRREISDAFGYSSANAAQYILKALERKGAITLGTNGSRKVAINNLFTG